MGRSLVAAGSYEDPPLVCLVQLAKPAVFLEQELKLPEATTINTKIMTLNIPFIPSNGW